MLAPAPMLMVMLQQCFCKFWGVVYVLVYKRTGTCGAFDKANGLQTLKEKYFVDGLGDKLETLEDTQGLRPSN